MFGSNAYMGLTYDKRIIDASDSCHRKICTGCAGSRFLNGTLDICLNWRRNWLNCRKDEALVFHRIYCKRRYYSCRCRPWGDYIICDDRDHASIVDGRRLAFATQLKYKHNDMEALKKNLENANRML